MQVTGRIHWLFLMLVLAAGCNRQDTEALARIGKKIAARAEIVTGEVRTRAANSWLGDTDLSLESRVAARLRWDKQLLDAPVEVHASGTVVELRGKVHDLQQHRRVVMLVESTTGVEEVKDDLVETDH
jgi:osmotically-inducible protein OsmY